MLLASAADFVPSDPIHTSPSGWIVIAIPFKLLLSVGCEDPFVSVVVVVESCFHFWLLSLLVIVVVVLVLVFVFVFVFVFVVDAAAVFSVVASRCLYVSFFVFSQHFVFIKTGLHLCFCCSCFIVTVVIVAAPVARSSRAST